MNERRFLELINLQIDGEISETEQEELEFEIMSDPRRRAMYRSYVRLQQASLLVGRQFGEALTESADLRQYQILARNSHNNWQRGAFYSVSALAAACLAVVTAVGVFKDVEWSGAGNHPLSVQESVSVEAVEPSIVVRSAGRAQFEREGQPRFNPEAFRFLNQTPGTPVRFDSQSSPMAWGSTNFRTNTSSRALIQGGTAFEKAEPANFEFKR